jgi:hypothetical protein
MAFREYVGACTSTPVNQRISSPVPSDAAEDEALFGDSSPGSLRGAWRRLCTRHGLQQRDPAPLAIPPSVGRDGVLRPALYTHAKRS